MVDMDHLHDAFFATEDETETEILADLIQLIEAEPPAPRRFYESGDAGRVLSDYLLEALGKVLRSIDVEKQAKRGRRALDFSNEKVLSEAEGGSCFEGESAKSRVNNPENGRVEAHAIRKLRGKGVKSQMMLTLIVSLRVWLENIVEMRMPTLSTDGLQSPSGLLWLSPNMGAKGLDLGNRLPRIRV